MSSTQVGFFVVVVVLFQGRANLAILCVVCIHRLEAVDSPVLPRCLQAFVRVHFLYNQPAAHSFPLRFLLPLSSLCQACLTTQPTSTHPRSPHPPRPLRPTSLHQQRVMPLPLLSQSVSSAFACSYSSLGSSFVSVVGVPKTHLHSGSPPSQPASDLHLHLTHRPDSDSVSLSHASLIPCHLILIYPTHRHPERKSLRLVSHQQHGGPDHDDESWDFADPDPVQKVSPLALTKHIPPPLLFPKSLSYHSSKDESGQSSPVTPRSFDLEPPPAAYIRDDRPRWTLNESKDLP